VKLIISRTSNHFDDDTPPCEGATQETVTRIDERTFHTPEQFQAACREDWFARGINHRTLWGPRGGIQGIARDFPNDMTVWFIEINTLEDLLALQDREGQLVIGTYFHNSDYREIEVYDDYRE
jgi:hypothetical protein